MNDEWQAGDRAEYKRDGVRGVHLAEVLEVKDGRAKIRLIRHCTNPYATVSKRAFWVRCWRLWKPVVWRERLR